LSQEAHLIVFKHQKSQPTGGIGAGVDINAVRAYVALARRGVTVHYNLTEVLLVQKKVIANPKKIVLRLLVQGNTWSNPSMGKEEVSTGERQCQVAEEKMMTIGHGLGRPQRWRNKR
jgi:hypothetical protein